MPGFIDHCRRETTRALGSSTRLGPDVTMWRCSTWINRISKNGRNESHHCGIILYVFFKMLPLEVTIFNTFVCRDTWLEGGGFQSGIAKWRHCMTWPPLLLRWFELLKKKREMTWARFAIPVSHIFGVGSIIWSQYMDSVIKR